ncbi:MAG: copper-binding protein [Allosphingosinicella sp.]|uniref:copper-binding protein n=1 Tax=Allosphingosinicella sp. TaxID=2823234 RepID=UPI00395D3265
MINSSLAGALALALALTACSDLAPPEGKAEASRIAPAADRNVYEAEGRVTEVADGRITISHGPVAELGWPAMTMSFTVRSADLAQGVSVGDRVQFGFTEVDNGYAIAALSKAP